MKLNTKILLIILPLLVVAIGCSGLYAYFTLQASALQNSRVQIDSILIDLVAATEGTASNTSANLDLFANDTLIQKYAVSTESVRYELLMGSVLRLLSSYQKAYPDYYEIRLLLPDGFEDVRLSTAAQPNISEFEAKSDIFTRMSSAQDQPGTAFFAMDPNTDQLAYFFARPLLLRDSANEAFDAKPTLRGYLSLTLSLDWLRSKMTTAASSKDLVLLLTDASGRILLSTEQQTVLQEGGTLLEASTNASSDQLLADELSGNLLDDWLTLNIGGQTGYLWSQPLGDGYRLAAWYPAEDIANRAAELAWFILAICLVSVLVVATVLYLQLNALIIRPILLLKRATDSIGRGKLGSQLQLAGNDEIASLAASVNAMSSKLLKSNEQIRFLAYHDTLTALPNRVRFYEFLDKALASAKRRKTRLAVLYLDLDDFKRVNDTLGHKAGDRLLGVVAERLVRCLRESDVIAYSGKRNSRDEDTLPMLARIGGDEFLILLQDIPDMLAPGHVAERIVAVISRPIPIDGNDCVVSASLGVTIYPDDGHSPDALIKNADIAMYHAKDQGRDNYQYFRDSMNSAMLERVEMERKLREALSENRLFLYYQPQRRLASDELYGVEALLRWQDPVAGLIPAATFIPFAEKNGLIVEIGRWVLETACRQAVEWFEATGKRIKLSVNVSAVQFARQDFATVVADVIESTGIDPASLCLEITETAFMEHLGKADQVLLAIRKLGVRIALDDFGAGYSSLNYLRRFPIDLLKIDRSFVNELGEQDGNTGAIITAIIAMAHALGMEVLAEGVENSQQLAFLDKQGCDHVQGYFLHHPLQADNVLDLLKAT